MGRAALLASVVLALAAPAAHAQFEPRIIGGSTTTIEQYPWQAAVVYDPANVSGNPFQRQFCGGSLISPYIVLTAGHCIHGTDPQNNSDLDPDDVNVVLGQTTLSTAPPSSEYDVQGVSKQSNYDDSYGLGQGVPSNDVGYLVLQSPYNGATPIDIAGPDEGTLWDPGSPEQITGWGATATSGAGSGGSDTLRHATVPIVTDASCASDYGGYFNGSTMVCAGYPEGGIDTCYGDSGGPMQAAIGGGAYRLVGITSWGSGCAEPDAPGVYTRVAGNGLRPAVASTVFNLEATFGLPHEDVVGGEGIDPPTITATSPASPANDNDPEVIGTVGAGSPTEVKIYENASCSGAPDATGTVALFTGAGITVNVTGDTTTALSARATDASSNDSGCSNTIDYVEDSTAPAAPTVTDTDPDSPANDNNPEVKGSAEAGSTVRLYESPSCGGAVQAQGTAAGFNSPGLTASVANDQANKFTATATDAAGNASGCSAGFDYIEDSTPPVNPSVSSTSHTVGVASTDPTVDVSFSGASDGLSGVDGFSYVWSTSSDTVPDMTKDAEENATGTTSPVLPDGSHSFHLRTRDNAGNWTTTVHLGPFVIDTTAPDNDPPETSITSGPSDPTSDSTPTFGFSSDEPGSTFECRFDSASFGPCAGPGDTHTPAALLADGVHTFEVQATDPADNTDPTPATRAFTVDTAPPTDPTLSSPSHTAGVASNDPTVEVSFSGATDGLSGVDGFSYVWDISSTTLPDTTKDAEQTATGTTSPSLPDGSSHYFHLRTRDNAGNWTATVHLGPFVIDSSLPSLPPAPPVLGAFQDSTPPVGFLSAKWKRKGALTLKVGCDENCTTTAGGVVAAGGARFKLRAAGAEIAADGSATLKLTPKGRGARRTLRQLLGSGARASARIKVTFVDPAGNSTTERLIVKPKK